MKLLVPVKGEVWRNHARENDDNDAHIMAVEEHRDAKYVMYGTRFDVRSQTLADFQRIYYFLRKEK